MQPISNEFLRTIAERLKLGNRAKPVCRVEVDRLAFIPGRVENLKWLTIEEKREIEIVRSVIKPDTSGAVQGRTETTYVNISFPVQGKSLANVSSEFGPRWGRQHNGIDIACPVGTPVLAAWEGRVVRTDHNPNQPGGKNITIQHANGYVTRYLHLQTILVQYGQEVSAGQTIALSGNTGTSTTGPHLHFEIHTGAQNGYGGTPVNPRPYLDGTKRIALSTINVGGGVENNPNIVVGVPGPVLLNEEFARADWYNSTRYVLDANFKSYSYTSTGQDDFSRTGVHRWTFDKNKHGASTIVSGFTIKMNASTESFLDLGYQTNLDDSSELRVYIDGQIVRRCVFGNTTKAQVITSTYVPAGEVDIRIEIRWGAEQSGYVDLSYVKVTSLSTVPQSFTNLKSVEKLDPTLAKGFVEEQKIENILFGTKQEMAQLQVGEFVYMDTLILDNVQSVDVDEQYDLSASQATVTISNPNGFYSPDYNPYLFPELHKQSPWSYSINGVHVGVLSENTPIRIYMGYGLNMIRMFTGLIDKVDISGESRLTITCRNMYKRILEKVLLEDKQYPKLEDNHLNIELNNNLADQDYRTQIIYHAQVQAESFGVDPLFLLAIARHETQMGTAGMGKPENGSFVLGYGCYGAGYCDPAYKGVERQMYYGAKRVAEALKSRNKTVRSWADVEYFHNGGDKGPAYTWSQDYPNWVNKVWQYYQEIKANPTNWRTNITPSTGTVSAEEMKRPWLKSAVVQDLVKEAGLYGWRVVKDDLNYPDAVIQETYLIEVNRATGRMIRAVPDKEGEFEEVPIESTLTPQGWLNPFVEAYGKEFKAYKYKVSDAINEVIQDTGYRAYCDRYGTFRLEPIDMSRPVVDEFTEDENLISINKTIDLSRARSHLVIVDGSGERENFIDKELLMELKGEVRTAVVTVPWAKSSAQKRKVAEHLFFDMKRLCRTLQVSIPMNPALDVLDRVHVKNRHTTTRSVYTIKGIRTSFSENGAIQIVDLMWSMDGTVV